MKNKKTFIIVVIIAIIVGVILFLSRNNPMNKFTFPKELVVENHTTHNSVDTIAMVVLNKVMKFDTINIQIYYIRDGVFKNGNMDIMAYIEKVPYNKHQYLLFLAKTLNIYSINDIIAHEMAHVEQMEKGYLIQSVHENYAVYNNDTIFYLKMPYEIRPFEIDAVNKQKLISNDLYKLLYK